MTEKDAIRAVDEATAEVNAIEGAHDNATAHQRDAVRAAHRLGYSIAALARRTGKHRNTISTWCKD